MEQRVNPVETGFGRAMVPTGLCSSRRIASRRVARACSCGGEARVPVECPPAASGWMIPAGRWLLSLPLFAAIGVYGQARSVTGVMEMAGPHCQIPLPQVKPELPIGVLFGGGGVECNMQAICLHLLLPGPFPSGVQPVGQRISPPAAQPFRSPSVCETCHRWALTCA